MAFIAICYMHIDLFALQHIADRPGKYRTYDAHQFLEFRQVTMSWSWNKNIWGTILGS